MDFFQKTMDFFQKNSHVFRISWEKIEGTREKREKVRRYIQKDINGRTNPRQKQIHGKNRKCQNQVKNKSTAETKRHPRQNKKDSTAKTKRIPHKIGRKEGQFVPKNKDLRSKILMQTLHFRPKNLVKRIIYCNFVHYKWGFLAAAAIQKFSLL